jgi:hypothetical protein
LPTRKRLTTLRVLCFTDEGETIHDWSTFAAGPDGCCIQFDRPILEERLRELSVKGVRSQKVDHLTIDQVNRKIADHSCRLEDLPFMKRYPFRCENEFRIICESTQSLTCDEIDFVPQAITKVTLSETLSEPDFNLRLKNIRSLEGFEHLEVNRSTLNDNSPWRDAGLRYIHAARENLPTPQAT